MIRRLILVIAALVLAAPAAAEPGPDALAARGREVAEQRCASCHAVAPGQSSPLREASPFAGRDMQHTAGLEGRLAALTREGHYDMPPMTLSSQDVEALLAYIRSLAPR